MLFKIKKNNVHHLPNMLQVLRFFFLMWTKARIRTQIHYIPTNKKIQIPVNASEPNQRQTKYKS